MPPADTLDVVDPAVDPAVTTADPAFRDEALQQATLWCDDGWTARIIKNEDDDGWAVSMTRAGDAEAALVGPWTMGRDKKNPKPLDAPAFHTLVKTANEVLRRAQQQLHATLHREVPVDLDDGTRLRVCLDIVPDDDTPTATLSARDADGRELARVPAPPSYRLTRDTARAWVDGGYRRPSRD